MTIALTVTVKKLVHKVGGPAKDTIKFSVQRFYVISLMPKLGIQI